MMSGSLWALGDPCAQALLAVGSGHTHRWLGIASPWDLTANVWEQLWVVQVLGEL